MLMKRRRRHRAPSMTELSERLARLEAEIAALRLERKLAPTPEAYRPPSAPARIHAGACPPGTCDYPLSWMGIQPPSCRRCGTPSGPAISYVTCLPEQLAPFGIVGTPLWCEGSSVSPARGPIPGPVTV